MTNKEKEKFIEERIKFWQRTLKLENWKIDFKFSDKLKVESEFANILISWGTEEATIAFNKKCPEKSFENTILHELLHLYVHTILVFTEDILINLCKPKIKKILIRELIMKEDIAVEKITKAFLDLAKDKNERNQSRT